VEAIKVKVESKVGTTMSASQETIETTQEQKDVTIKTAQEQMEAYQGKIGATIRRGQEEMKAQRGPAKKGWRLQEICWVQTGRDHGKSGGRHLVVC
jgi:hypothetical protein